MLEELRCKREEDNTRGLYTAVVIKSCAGIVGGIPHYLSALCSIFIRACKDPVVEHNYVSPSYRSMQGVQSLIAKLVGKTLTIHQKSMKTTKVFSHLTFVAYGITNSTSW